MLVSNKNIKNVIISLLVLFVAGCSDDVRSIVGNEQPLTYSFAAVDETRAISETFTDYSGTQFGVYATNYLPSYAVAPGNTASIMDNVKVTYDGTSCSTDHVYYWPDGEIHFAAYSPYVDDPSASSLRITPPTTPYAGYTFEGNVEGRTNYMYSDEELGQLSNFAGGVVPLKFRHAVSKITFAVRLLDAQSGYVKLNVKSLSLENIRYSGNVKFTHNGNTAYNNVIAASAQNKWVASNANDVWDTKEFPVGVSYDNGYLTGYTIDVNGLNNITDESPHASSDCLYLMPQLLYQSGKSQFIQSVNIVYALTINGVTTDYTKTIPLYSSEISKWTINNHVNYTINIMPPGGTATLDVAVQPWDLVEFTNQFDNTVTIEKSGRIKWTEGTYNTLNGYDLVLLDDINTPAEMTFTISGPLGGTWQAIFVTKSGDPNAFTLSQSEGEVGKPVTLMVGARQQNTSDISNQAELLFVVRTSSNILPVDALTATGANYNIIQNINK